MSSRRRLIFSVAVASIELSSCPTSCCLALAFFFRTTSFSSLSSSDCRRSTSAAVFSEFFVNRMFSCSKRATLRSNSTVWMVDAGSAPFLPAYLPLIASLDPIIPRIGFLSVGSLSDCNDKTDFSLGGLAFALGFIHEGAKRLVVVPVLIGVVVAASEDTGEIGLLTGDFVVGAGFGAGSRSSPSSSSPRSFKSSRSAKSSKSPPWLSPPLPVVKTENAALLPPALPFFERPLLDRVEVHVKVMEEPSDSLNRSVSVPDGTLAYWPRSM
mmetsp:Transcript_9515/g.28745  ORF Transcript_9515/g.28745 Transcript_9515/m.28745 type:complete len:269 (-) Transcript_9515:428-1234(-)